MSRTDELIKKLDRIIETEEKVLSESEIRNASHSRDVLTRSLIAQALAVYPQTFAQELLLQLLEDKNKDVRSSAAIGLENFLHDDVITALQSTFLNDSDPLTRGYAGYALIKQAKDRSDVIMVVEDALARERNSFVRVNCHCALYLFCKKEDSFEQILRCFQSKKYQTRCAVGNVLMEILNEQNAKTILIAIERVLKKEDVPAVVSTLEALKKAVGRILI